MTDKQLISKIKSLQEIRPNQEWVSSLKKEIMGAEKERHLSAGFVNDIRLGISFIFQYKQAFATVACLGLLMLVFGLSQNALPGDVLYPVKKVAEKGQSFLLSEKGQSKLVFEVANKRLDELTRAAENNSVRNLAPAINEYRASVSQVVKSLNNGIVNKDSRAIKEIAIEVRKLAEKEQIIESLGIEIGGSQELDNALAQLVDQEIKDLETRTLAPDQEQALIDIKADFEAKDYSQALERILLLNP